MCFSICVLVYSCIAVLISVFAYLCICIVVCGCIRVFVHWCTYLCICVVAYWRVRVILYLRIGALAYIFVHLRIHVLARWCIY